LSAPCLLARPAPGRDLPAPAAHRLPWSMAAGLLPGDRSDATGEVGMTSAMQKQASLAAGLSLLLALSACGRPDPPVAVAAPVEVTVLTLRPQPVAVTAELAGRATALLTAEVRPQVGGIVEKRVFREGSDVKAGDTLYLIAAAPYQAAADNAVAMRAKAAA